MRPLARLEVWHVARRRPRRPPRRERPEVLATDPVFALVETNCTLGIHARTIVPEWFGEKPDYNWITDSLWRRDERARQAQAPNAPE